MKRLTILSLTLVFCIGMLSSCSKRCKGGGWYGDRNLGYAPIEKKIDKTNELATTIVKEIETEEACD